MTTLPKNATGFDFNLFPFAHDFILDGKPRKFCRESDGSHMLKVGATLLLPYGKGYVEKRTGDRTYLVRMVEVSNTWTQARRSGEITAREYIQERNERYNTQILHDSSWLTNYLNDKKRGEAMLNLLVDDDVIEVRMHDGLVCTEYAYETACKPKAKKTAIQSFARLAYRAEPLDLDDDLEADAETEQAIQEELSLEFGE